MLPDEQDTYTLGDFELSCILFCFNVLHSSDTDVEETQPLPLTTSPPGSMTKSPVVVEASSSPELDRKQPKATWLLHAVAIILLPGLVQ